VLLGWFVSRRSALRAQQYADQHRSVVAHLVRDEPVPAGPESQQRAAYAGGVEDAIAQMERMMPLPLADLATAWRRVGYSQADRGQTAASLVSIERSIEWAKRYMESGAGSDAASQLAESLLYAALLHNRRGNMAKASDAALEAIRLVDTLPAPSRAARERTPHFLRALWLGARRRARAGDVEGGRALLRRSIEIGRTIGRLAQLRSTLDLVWFERAAGDEQRVAATCGDARAVGVSTPRLAALCGLREDSSRVADEAGLARESAIFERQLLADPERYRYRLQLARRKLQLARFAHGKYDAVRANELIQEARTLTEPLVRADPQNQNVQRLLTRIERLSGRVDAR
jgi:hypothetical protein